MDDQAAFELQDVARHWMHAQLAGLNLAQLFDPAQTAIQQGSQSVEEALLQLTRVILISGVARIQNPQNAQKSGGGPGVSKEKDTFNQELKSRLLVPLLATLAPLATFATIVTQSTSGLSLFLSAVNVLAATLAPVLLPIFLVLGAAVLAISAMLWTRLEPALGDFYVWVVQAAIPMFKSLVESVKSVGTAFDVAGEEIDLFVADMLTATANLMKMLGIEEVGGKKPEDLKKTANEFREDVVGRRNKRIEEGIGGVKGGLGDVGKGFDAQDEWLKAIRNAPNAAEADRIQKQGPKKVGPVGEAEGAFGKGLQDMIQQFKFEQGPKPSITGVAQASKDAQLAAVGGSPMERRMREIASDILMALGRIEGAVIGNKPAPAVGP